MRLPKVFHREPNEPSDSRAKDIEEQQVKSKETLNRTNEVLKEMRGLERVAARPRKAHR